MLYKFNDLFVWVPASPSVSLFSRSKQDRQSCILSLAPFTACEEYDVRASLWSDDVRVDGRQINNLRFADDILVFFSQSNAENCSKEFQEDAVSRSTKVKRTLWVFVNAAVLHLRLNGFSSAITLVQKTRFDVFTKWCAKTILKPWIMLILTKHLFKKPRLVMGLSSPLTKWCFIISFQSELRMVWSNKTPRLG